MAGIIARMAAANWARKKGGLGARNLTSDKSNKVLQPFGERFVPDLDNTYLKYALGSTGLRKIIVDKFRELGLNFLKLADWLCIGRPSCLTALGRKFSNRGHFFCTTLYRVVHLFLR